VNTSDALLKLRVSEKPSQSEYSAGRDSEEEYSEEEYSEEEYSEGGDSEGEYSAEASLSIIVSFIHKNEAILTLN
jgi:hypothetical protein